MSCLVPRVLNGKTYVAFHPNAQMHAYALCRALPGNLSKRDAEICEQISLGLSTLVKWKAEYEPFFSEWLENFLLRNSDQKLLKNMLEDVGNQKALEGDFQFWKQMALKHGVISPEQQNLKIIPVNLGQYDKWSESELEQYRNTLLGSLGAVENEGGPEVVDAAEPGGPESHSGGDTPMPQEPMEVSEELDSYRERSHQDESDI